MSDYVILPKEDYVAALNATREKTGSLDLIKSGNLAAEIRSIATADDVHLQEVTVTPTGQDFTKYPDALYDGFTKVTVKGDENLVPENIPEGVTIYGVQGNRQDPDVLDLQFLNITPTGEEITVNAPDGVAYNEVIVQGDENLTPENIREGVTIYGQTGTFEGEGGGGGTASGDFVLRATLNEFGNSAGYLAVSPQMQSGDIATIVLNGHEEKYTVHQITVDSVTASYIGDDPTGSTSVHGFTIIQVPADLFGYPAMSTAFIFGSDSSPFFDAFHIPHSTVTEIADAGKLPLLLTYPQYGVGGGSGDVLPVPAEYAADVAHAKTLYTGAYSDLVVFDQGQWRAVSFLMDDFTVTDYNPSTTEFKATGWYTCGYEVATGVWAENDYRNTESTGTNFIQNVVFATKELEYNGAKLWPLAEPGGVSAVDFSGWSNGSFGVTLTDGTAKTGNVTFDGSGNPATITIDGVTTNLTGVS